MDETVRRRRATAAADALVQPAPAQAQAAKVAPQVPDMAPQFQAITTSVFTLDDPEAEYAHLEQAIKLTDALAPAALQSALNEAEDNARRAHKLYVVARAEFEHFEATVAPILESMRDAANRELQAEKDAKQRSKAITQGDVDGRAQVLFPDEWSVVVARKAKATGMTDHLKVLANLWQQRCFSLSTMLNAGKRS